MSENPLLDPYLLAALVALVVLGAFFLGRATGAGSRRLAELESAHREAREARDALQGEMDEYKRRVADHFAETSHRLHDLTLQYRSVYEHLAQSASDLAPEAFEPLEAGLIGALPPSEASRAGAEAGSPGGEGASEAPAAADEPDEPASAAAEDDDEERRAAASADSGVEPAGSGGAAPAEHEATAADEAGTEREPIGTSEEPRSAAGR